ncbi:hypothetical protein HDV05_002137 [Chytridiales sp. JEL 0842]|nr:hypothetical protein HDV05_002137 [Chytridiales sp. JEL 0842]
MFIKTTLAAIVLALTSASAAAQSTPKPKVFLFSEPHFSGKSQTIDVPSWGNCVDVPLAFNDLTSSLLWTGPTHENAQMCFYEHFGCLGEAKCVQWRDQAFLEDLQGDFGGFNDRISSMVWYYYLA